MGQYITVNYPSKSKSRFVSIRNQNIQRLRPYSESTVNKILLNTCISDIYCFQIYVLSVMHAISSSKVQISIDISKLTLILKPREIQTGVPVAPKKDMFPQKTFKKKEEKKVYLFH